jgi:cytochrome b561
MNLPKRYHPALAVLHWLTVLLMLGAGFLADGEGGGLVGIFHQLGWFLAMMLILAHVGGAIYHQFILKDKLMARMWFGK